MLIRIRDIKNIICAWVLYMTGTCDTIFFFKRNGLKSCIPISGLSRKKSTKRDREISHVRNILYLTTGKPLERPDISDEYIIRRTCDIIVSHQ
jgi:hypothetical protein